jgi:isochorismate pyruvate lyase
MSPHKNRCVAELNAHGDVEPSPEGPALRQFKDLTYKPVGESLNELRAGIDELDQQIVSLMAQRAMLVKDAARFKANSFQVAAPARQVQVFEKAKALAKKSNLGFEGFEDVVDATYRTMVAGFIAAEQRYFQDALIDTAEIHSSKTDTANS